MKQLVARLGGQPGWGSRLAAPVGGRPGRGSVSSGDMNRRAVASCSATGSSDQLAAVSRSMTAAAMVLVARWSARVAVIAHPVGTYRHRHDDLEVRCHAGRGHQVLIAPRW